MYIKRGRGRPKKAEKDKLIPITVSMTRNFRDWLDREARKKKKSRFEVIADAFKEKLVSDCQLTADERKKGVKIEDLIDEKQS